MKWTTLLCSFLLCAALASAAPMTHEQVAEMVKAKGLEWAADWIASVYTATPEVTMPDLTSVVTDRDVAVSAAEPLGISIASKLAYHVTVGPWLFKGVVPHVDPWVVVESGGVGLAVGVAGTLAVLALSGHLK